jgi:O-antigen ligase
MIEKSCDALAQADVRPMARPRAWPPGSGLDLLFAAALVAAVSGLRFFHTNIPVFAAVVPLILVANPGAMNRLTVQLVFVPPLIMFLILHVASAFRWSLGNGAFFLFQTILLSVFVWLFVARYAVHPMARFMRFSGIGFLGLLFFVIAWHIVHGSYFSWKRLLDAKAVFNVLPLLLVVASRSPRRGTRVLFPVLFAIVLISIALSGERKAYILLGLSAPFLINYRSLLVYLIPIALVTLAPAAVKLDKSGYVERQISTLVGLSQGRVVNTVSDEGRSKAAKAAVRTFRTSPVFGVGTNAEPKIVDRLDQSIPGPHNEWLRVSAENGVVGVFLYGASVLWGILGNFRRRIFGRIRSRSEMLVSWTALATLVLYVSFEASDYMVILAFIFIPYVQYLRLDPADCGEALRLTRQVRQFAPRRAGGPSPRPAARLSSPVER